MSLINSQGLRRMAAGIHGVVSFVPVSASAAVALLAFAWQRNPTPSVANNFAYALAAFLCAASLLSTVGWLVTWNLVALTMRSRTQLQWALVFVTGWVLLIGVLVAAPQGFALWYLD